MKPRSALRGVLVTAMATSLGSIEAAPPMVTRQQAESFAKKLNIIAQPTKAQRTSVSEGELNSWFAYRAPAIMPAGLADPSVSLVGNGKVTGRGMVDLDRVAKKKATGGLFDPWSFLGGRVPVVVTGTLHTKDGVGRFALESAQVSSVPVPKFLLQELLSAYSRTPARPDGFNLEDPFELPASIQRIEVGEGRAVVVQ